MHRALSLMSLLAMLAVPVAAQVDRGVRHRDFDFSGTWVRDAARSESSGTPNAVRDATVVISQTDRQVTVDALRNGVRDVVRYALPGSREPNSVGTSGREGLTVEWDGATMVTRTPHVVNGMTVTTIERRTLGQDGKEMTVETIVRVEHGYEGLAGNSASTPLKEVYVLQAR